MSVRVTQRVRRHADVSGAAFAVLLAIADRADDDGYAWPGVAWIADQARVNRRTVQRVLRKLVESGDLVIVSPGDGRRRSHRFRVATGLEADEKGRHDAAVSAVETATSSAENGDIQCSETATSSAENGGTMPPDPSTRRQRDPSENRLRLVHEQAGEPATRADGRIAGGNGHAGNGRKTLYWDRVRFDREASDAADRAAERARMLADLEAVGPDAVEQAWQAEIEAESDPVARDAIRDLPATQGRMLRRVWKRLREARHAATV